MRALGYEEKSIPFEVNANEFTKLLVKLEKLKEPKSNVDETSESPETQLSSITGTEPEGNPGSETESSGIDKKDSSTNGIESENSDNIEPSYSIYGKVNLIESNCCSTRVLGFCKYFYILLTLFFGIFTW